MNKSEMEIYWNSNKLGVLKKYYVGKTKLKKFRCKVFPILKWNKLLESTTIELYAKNEKSAEHNLKLTKEYSDFIDSANKIKYEQPGAALTFQVQILS